MFGLWRAPWILDPQNSTTKALAYGSSFCLDRDRRRLFARRLCRHGGSRKNPIDCDGDFRGVEGNSIRGIVAQEGALVAPNLVRF